MTENVDEGAGRPPGWVSSKPGTSPTPPGGPRSGLAGRPATNFGPAEQLLGLDPILQEALHDQVIRLQALPAADRRVALAWADEVTAMLAKASPLTDGPVEMTRAAVSVLRMVQLCALVLPAPATEEG